MASTYTTNAGLAKPGTNDSGWGTTLNGDIDQLDGLSAIGNGAVKPTEIPSASLNVRVAACSFIKRSDGSVVTTTATASQAMTGSATNYVYLTATGTLTVNTSGFPGTGTAHVRLAVVVAGVSTITSITDARLLLQTTG